MFWARVLEVLPVIAGAVAGWVAGGQVATRRIDTVGEKLLAAAYAATKPSDKKDK